MSIPVSSLPTYLVPYAAAERPDIDYLRELGLVRTPSAPPSRGEIKSFMPSLDDLRRAANSTQASLFSKTRSDIELLQQRLRNLGEDTETPGLEGRRKLRRLQDRLNLALAANRGRMAVRERSTTDPTDRARVFATFANKRAVERLQMGYRDHDTREMVSAVGAGAPPDFCFHNGETVLTALIRLSDVGGIRGVLALGADPNLTTMDGVVPCVLATLVHLDTLRALLTTPALDINRCNVFDDEQLQDANAVMVSVAHHQHVKTRALVAHRSFAVHAANSKGRDALMTACRYLNPDAVGLLLKRGASPSAQDEDGYVAADWFRAAVAERAATLATLRAQRAQEALDLAAGSFAGGGGGGGGKGRRSTRGKAGAAVAFALNAFGISSSEDRNDPDAPDDGWSPDLLRAWADLRASGLSELRMGSEIGGFDARELAEVEAARFPADPRPEFIEAAAAVSGGAAAAAAHAMLPDASLLWPADVFLRDLPLPPSLAERLGLEQPGLGASSSMGGRAVAGLLGSAASSGGSVAGAGDDGASVVSGRSSMRGSRIASSAIRGTAFERGMPRVEQNLARLLRRERDKRAANLAAVQAERSGGPGGVGGKYAAPGSARSTSRSGGGVTAEHDPEVQALLRTGSAHSRTYGGQRASIAARRANVLEDALAVMDQRGTLGGHGRSGHGDHDDDDHDGDGLGPLPLSPYNASGALMQSRVGGSGRAGSSSASGGPGKVIARGGLLSNSILCRRCRRERQAMLHCVDCGATYCSLCCMDTHSRGHMRFHSLQPWDAAQRGTQSLVQAALAPNTAAFRPESLLLGSQADIANSLRVLRDLQTMRSEHASSAAGGAGGTARSVAAGSEGPDSTRIIGGAGPHHASSPDAHTHHHAPREVLLAAARDSMPYAIPASARTRVDDAAELVLQIGAGADVVGFGGGGGGAGAGDASSRAPDMVAMLLAGKGAVVGIPSGGSPQRGRSPSKDPGATGLGDGKSDSDSDASSSEDEGYDGPPPGAAGLGLGAGVSTGGGVSARRASAVGMALAAEIAVSHAVETVAARRRASLDMVAGIAGKIGSLQVGAVRGSVAAAEKAAETARSRRRSLEMVMQSELGGHGKEHGLSDRDAAAAAAMHGGDGGGGGGGGERRRSMLGAATPYTMLSHSPTSGDDGSPSQHSRRFGDGASESGSPPQLQSPGDGSGGAIGGVRRASVVIGGMLLTNVELVVGTGAGAERRSSLAPAINSSAMIARRASAASVAGTLGVGSGLDGGTTRRGSVATFGALGSPGSGPSSSLVLSGGIASSGSLAARRLSVAEQSAAPIRVASSAVPTQRRLSMAEVNARRKSIAEHNAAAMEKYQARLADLTAAAAEQADAAAAVGAGEDGDDGTGLRDDDDDEEEGKEGRDDADRKGPGKGDDKDKDKKAFNWSYASLDKKETVQALLAEADAAVDKRRRASMVGGASPAPGSGTGTLRRGSAVGFGPEGTGPANRRRSSVLLGVTPELLAAASHGVGVFVGQGGGRTASILPPHSPLAAGRRLSSVGSPQAAAGDAGGRRGSVAASGIATAVLRAAIADAEGGSIDPKERDVRDAVRDALVQAEAAAFGINHDDDDEVVTFGNGAGTGRGAARRASAAHELLSVSAGRRASAVALINSTLAHAGHPHAGAGPAAGLGEALASPGARRGSAVQSLVAEGVAVAAAVAGIGGSSSAASEAQQAAIARALSTRRRMSVGEVSGAMQSELRAASDRFGGAAALGLPPATEEASGAASSASPAQRRASLLGSFAVDAGPLGSAGSPAYGSAVRRASIAGGGVSPARRGSVVGGLAPAPPPVPHAPPAPMAPDDARRAARRRSSMFDGTIAMAATGAAAALADDEAAGKLGADAAVAAAVADVATVEASNGPTGRVTAYGAQLVTSPGGSGAGLRRGSLSLAVTTTRRASVRRVSVGSLEAGEAPVLAVISAADAEADAAHAGAARIGSEATVGGGALRAAIVAAGGFDPIALSRSFAFGRTTPAVPLFDRLPEMRLARSYVDRSRWLLAAETLASIAAGARRGTADIDGPDQPALALYADLHMATMYRLHVPEPAALLAVLASVGKQLATLRAPAAMFSALLEGYVIERGLHEALTAKRISSAVAYLRNAAAAWQTTVLGACAGRSHSKDPSAVPFRTFTTAVEAEVERERSGSRSRSRGRGGGGAVSVIVRLLPADVQFLKPQRGVIRLLDGLSPVIERKVMAGEDADAPAEMDYTAAGLAAMGLGSVSASLGLAGGAGGPGYGGGGGAGRSAMTDGGGSFYGGAATTTGDGLDGMRSASMADGSGAATGGGAGGGGSPSASGWGWAASAGGPAGSGADGGPIVVEPDVDWPDEDDDGTGAGRQSAKAKMRRQRARMEAQQGRNPLPPALVAATQRAAVREARMSTQLEQRRMQLQSGGTAGGGGGGAYSSAPQPQLRPPSQGHAGLNRPTTASGTLAAAAPIGTDLPPLLALARATSRQRSRGAGVSAGAAGAASDAYGSGGFGAYDSHGSWSGGAAASPTSPASAGGQQQRRPGTSPTSTSPGSAGGGMRRHQAGVPTPGRTAAAAAARRAGSAFPEPPSAAGIGDAAAVADAYGASYGESSAAPWAAETPRGDVAVAAAGRPWELRAATPGGSARPYSQGGGFPGAGAGAGRRGVPAGAHVAAAAAAGAGAGQRLAYGADGGVIAEEVSVVSEGLLSASDSLASVDQAFGGGDGGDAGYGGYGGTEDGGGDPGHYRHDSYRHDRDRQQQQQQQRERDGRSGRSAASAAAAPVPPHIAELAANPIALAAARKLQAVARGLVARRKIADKHAKDWLPRRDGGSGAIYYIHLRSGVTKWTPPPYLRARDIDYRAVCASCEYPRLATAYCRTCGSCHCDECAGGEAHAAHPTSWAMLKGPGGIPPRGSGAARDPICHSCVSAVGIIACYGCNSCFCPHCYAAYHADASTADHAFAYADPAFEPPVE